MVTAFEPLNRSLETFVSRLIRINERSENSKRVFKKPRYYKNEFDGCRDTWIKVIKLNFEEEDLTERQECSALTSNFEVTKAIPAGKLMAISHCLWAFLKLPHEGDTTRHVMPCAK